MDKKAKREKLLEHQLKAKGYVVQVINRGEQVKYFDGVFYVEGEITRSGLDSNTAAWITVHCNTLYVANPSEQRWRIIEPVERQEIAARIRDWFVESGTGAVVE
ncbi:hypothetical protein BGP77_16660 [Saccharospirillum sp. MSK14-1]|uniref:hypothetical protein n=1 Tax=Saccharospirillum sp. MSK14-1 TaxID=1897632 RepID=UPI000D3A9D69|nr:hypothetical protein [Saccharospirillum sp. MSK14-1]PTY38083.1 hypothetical protein BGP77_16660 [Saccharospirillum sp. MSK14-1]